MPPGNNTRFTLPDWIYNLSFEEALKLLLYGAFGSTAPTGTGVPTTGGGGGSTQNVNLTQVGGATVALGQAAAAASLPVVIASNQTSIPVTPQTVTSSPHNLAASTALTIPAGAKGWTVSCLTGTLSIACGTTASALPAGFSDNDPNIVGADITITTASASTAYVRWGT